jgi:uncharacterized membrane protein
MKKLIGPGRIIFALGFMALGGLQFFVGDFIIGRPPSPSLLADIPGKFAWACISGALLIIAGIAILLNKKAALAAFVMGIMTLVFSFLLRSLPDLISKSGEGILWALNAYKILALFGGAMIITVSCSGTNGRNFTRFFSNDLMLLTGVALVALFLIMAGAAHFKFNVFVEEFIPAYIPIRAFWADFTGVSLFAGGVGLLLEQTRKWAALFSGLMILLWFFLLHIPRVINAQSDYFEWMGVFESFTFSGILFVLAGLSSRNK